MSVAIRKCLSEADVATATELDRACLPADDPYTEPGTVYWLAWKGGKAVGMAALIPVAKEPGVYFLARAAVLPGYRGAGIQKRLVRARERYVKDAGGHCIISYVYADNVASANSLIRCGYALYLPEAKWSGLARSLYFHKTLDARRLA